MAYYLKQWCLQKRATCFVLLILLIHAGLLARIAWVKSPVYDEVGHLPAGVSHWVLGRFELYKVNPPLVRSVAAIPVLLASPEVSWDLYTDNPYERPEFWIGRDFILANGFHSFFLFTMARWACIPFSLLGGWICWRWGKELFGTVSGVFALVLWCFCPNILGWGATIVPDVAAASTGVLACYSFWRWTSHPSWKVAFAAGLSLGLAELTKSTWIILFGLWPTLWIAGLFQRTTILSRQKSGLQLIAILLLGLNLLNLGYGFQGSFQLLGEYRFISRTLAGEIRPSETGNRFIGTPFQWIPVPFPQPYIEGIDIQKHDFENGESAWSYLRGEQKHGGWWYYYLYAMGVKLPAGTLLMVVFSLILPISCKAYRIHFYSELILWAPAIAVIILVSSQTGFNHYFRYIYPALPMLFVSASRVVQVRHNGTSRCVAFWYCILLWIVTSSLLTFPHSMSYFNELAGGPKGGPVHLIDANIDWGQDLLELTQWVKNHPEHTPIYIDCFGNTPIEVFGINSNSIMDYDKLKPGCYAISVNELYYNSTKSDSAIYQYLKRTPPNDYVGYSIYIYVIQSPDDI